MLQQLNRGDDALAAMQRLLAVEPDDDEAFSLTMRVAEGSAEIDDIVALLMAIGMSIVAVEEPGIDSWLRSA